MQTPHRQALVLFLQSNLGTSRWEVTTKHSLVFILKLKCKQCMRIEWVWRVDIHLVLLFQSCSVCSNNIWPIDGAVIHYLFICSGCMPVCYKWQMRGDINSHAGRHSVTYQLLLHYLNRGPLIVVVFFSFHFKWHLIRNFGLTGLKVITACFHCMFMCRQAWFCLTLVRYAGACSLGVTIVYCSVKYNARECTWVRPWKDLCYTVNPFFLCAVNPFFLCVPLPTANHCVLACSISQSVRAAFL